MEIGSPFVFLAGEKSHYLRNNWVSIGIYGEEHEAIGEQERSQRVLRADFSSPNRCILHRFEVICFSSVKDPSLINARAGPEISKFSFTKPAKMA